MPRAALALLELQASLDPLALLERQAQLAAQVPQVLPGLMGPPEALEAQALRALRAVQAALVLLALQATLALPVQLVLWV